MSRSTSRPGAALVPWLLLAAVAACGGCRDTRSAERLDGDYTRPHAAWVFHGNEPIESEVDDRLLLTATASGALEFRLELVSLDGNACALEGIAQPRGAAFLYTRSPAEASCDLLFEPAPAGLLLTVDPLRCLRSLCPDFGSPAEGVFVRRTP